MLQVSILNCGAMVSTYMILVISAIQDGSQDHQQDVQVEDWPKLSGVWFLMQVSFLNARAIVVIFVISW